MKKLNNKGESSTSGGIGFFWIITSMFHYPKSNGYN